MEPDTNSSERRVIPASEILAKIEQGEDVEYDNVIVEGDLDISELDLPTEHVNKKVIGSKITITNSEIHGRINFSNAHFKRRINFRGAKFGGDVNFKRTKFGGDVNFIGAEVTGNVHFEEAEFDGYATFRGARFNGVGYFDRAKFDGEADFTDMEFDVEAKFRGTSFGKDAKFRGTSFGKDANFTEADINGNADFGVAKFLGEDAKFVRTRFGRDAKFRGMSFAGESKFTGAKFAGNADFRFVSFLKTANFIDAQFISNALFDTTKFKGTIYLTRIKFDKLYIKWSEIGHRLKYDDTVYLLLIENFRKLGFFEDADNCYFQFRIEQRKQTKGKHRSKLTPKIVPQVVSWVQLKFLEVLDILLEVLYGYGVRPMRPIAWSFFIVILLSIFFYGIGGIVPDDTAKNGESECLNITIIGSLKFSSAVFLSGTKLFIDQPDYTNRTGVLPDSNRVTLSEWVFGFGRVMGALLFFMFIYAVGMTSIRRI